MVSNTSPIKPKLSLVVTPGKNEVATMISELEASRSAYNRVAIDKAVRMLKDNAGAISPTSPVIETVTIENLTKASAARLYALVGRIRRQDGFADLFDAFAFANFPLDRPTVHLDFVGENILRVELAQDYRNRTGRSL